MGNRLKCPSVRKSQRNKLVSLWKPDKSQLVLTVAEIDFNFPANSVKIENLFIGSKIGINVNHLGTVRK